MRTVDEWTDRYAELLVEEGWGGAGDAAMRKAQIRRALRRLAIEIREEIVASLSLSIAEVAVRSVLASLPCDSTEGCALTTNVCAPCRARAAS